MSDLHIPSPCHESWDAMSPAGSGRHCATCNHVVVDVASMPVAEGRRVLSDVADTVLSGGRRICVRAQATPAGRLVPGRRKLLTSALAGILACSIAGCGGDGPDLVEPPERSGQPTSVQSLPEGGNVPAGTGGEVLMGDICEAPIKGKIVAAPVTTRSPAPVVLGVPVPPAKDPAD